MTGIERLRELGNGYIEHAWSAAGKSRGMLIIDIADQIERERACDADTIENARLIVGGVIDEMERHVSGVEGAEDSPVARWERELREALGGDGRDPAADVSVSVYDLLPQKDREAIAWVRERGGLGAVTIEHSNLWSTVNETCSRLGVERVGDLVTCAQAIWRKVDRLKSLLGESVPRAYAERRIASRQRQIDESHAALRRRNERIRELERRVDIRERANNGLNEELNAMRPRLMPEDKEWPRYKDEAPVNFDDTVIDAEGFEFKVKSVEFHPNGFTLHGEFGQEHWYEDDERFDYPALKVLDADGEEIRVKETVFDKNTGEELIVTGFEDGRVWCEHRMTDADALPVRGMWSPGLLTHERPESWERLEEDAMKTTCDYFGHVGGETCETCPGYADSSSQGGRGCRHAQMADLVRRAKKLAGVSE